MKWNVVYFESSRGKRFIQDFIDKQNPFIKAKFVGLVEFLGEYGPLLGGKYTKKLQKELYELRITGKE